jgi:hypothetical protein
VCGVFFCAAYGLESRRVLVEVVCVVVVEVVVVAVVVNFARATTLAVDRGCDRGIEGQPASAEPISGGA